MNLTVTQPEFTIKDLWNTDYFIQNIRVLFNKPWANDSKASNEYNKVISQPLKTLAYSKVLNVRKVGRYLRLSVNNEEILEWIAQRDRNAYVFLYEFFTKVLKDSKFLHNLEDYKNGQLTRDEVYEKYIELVRGNSRTKSRLDIKRIFHKVFNVYAAEHMLIGSSGKHPRLYSDLMYNRINWRDIGKDKTQTRHEAEEAKTQSKKSKAEKKETLKKYYTNKAISLLRKIQVGSEVHDQWGGGDATQVHHIFPKSQFPGIAHYIENLILLTPTQHYTKAHPNNKTQEVNRDYQMVCLISKADTIDKSIAEVGDKYYRKESFIYVINTGLNEDLRISLSFPEIKGWLLDRYHNQP